MPASFSGVQRVRSVFSMRSRKRPATSRASSAFRIADKAWPRCSRPVGLGAKRKVGRLAGGMADC